MPGPMDAVAGAIIGVALLADHIEGDKGEWLPPEEAAKKDANEILKIWVL